MNFKYAADKEYFEKNVFGRKLKVEDIETYFDFSNPNQKRFEFNKIRNKIYRTLLSRYGKVCFLKIENICNEKSGFDVDHLIPLSSNVLNKKLRKIKPSRGQKVPTQSFGSNNLKNLIIACKKCNAHKKHNFPTIEQVRNIEKAKQNL